MTTNHLVLAGLILGDLLVMAYRTGKARPVLTGTDLAFGILQSAAMIWLALS